MRIFKMVGALVVVLAFSAIAVATASAAETLWKWLPGSAGETFTGEAPAAVKLATVGGSQLACAKAKLTGEFLKEGTTEGKDATLKLVLVDLEGCKAEGLLPFNTLGDAKEVVLIHLEIHDCLIKAGEFGLLILPLEVHIEIPSVALLIVLSTKGLFIALVREEAGGKKTKFELTAKQEKGKQGIEKCEGGEKETLLAKIDSKETENAALEATIKLTTSGKIDKEGETMMEK